MSYTQSIILYSDNKEPIAGTSSSKLNKKNLFLRSSIIIWTNRNCLRKRQSKRLHDPVSKLLSYGRYKGIDFQTTTCLVDEDSSESEMSDVA